MSSSRLLTPPQASPVLLRGWETDTAVTHRRCGHFSGGWLVRLRVQIIFETNVEMIQGVQVHNVV